MVLKRFLIGLLFLFTITSSLIAAGVGSWKNYLAYTNIQWAEQGGNKVYVLADNSLYAYNRNDQSIETYSKLTGLSDMNIRLIGWNSAARRLVIVYDNYNIDLLDERGNVVNVPDYYLRSMTIDKTINSIDMNGNNCYLSTGFGIVRLNVARAEFLDTYNLSFAVNYSYIEGGNLYAASETQGVYRGSLGSNLLDRNNWVRVGDYVARNKTADPTLLEQAHTLRPDGPRYNTFVSIDFLNNKLYSVGGYFKAGNIETNRPGIVQVWDKPTNVWSIYQDDISSITGYWYGDVNAFAVDPRDPNHVFVGGRTGLYEFQNGQLSAFYNRDNSLLQGAMDRNRELDNNYVLINGLSFDNVGNLWIVNSQTSRENLLRLSPDGQMTSFSKTDLISGGVGASVLSDMHLDSRNQFWFCNDDYRMPALFNYDPSTDNLRTFTHFINDDGATLEILAVRCWAEDPSGDIWVGTTAGPLLLERNQMSNPANAYFTQIKIPRNDGTNQADYLLGGLDITAIALDGAGRKWMAARDNGVYLISADNMTQEQHFLTSNSELLSNNVLDIAIDHATGEVFFATEAGLCSYMGNATQPSSQTDNTAIYAYPNPVRPGYTGPITIIGLTLNADVKIVTTNGTLVAEGISNGGAFTWDGRDKKGQRVASGIYIVETANAQGESSSVCKIAVVN